MLLLVWVGGFRAVGDPVADVLADPRKFVIEMEDYDFDGGKFRSSASVMPYGGGDYEGLAGIPGVDFSRAAVPGFLPEYRSGDSPVVPIFEQVSERRLDRGTWKMWRNFSLAYIEAGQWFNYTRQFLRGGYRVWIAAESADASPGGIRGRLQQVISGVGTPNQVVEDLGFIEAPGSGGWGNLVLVPLQAPFGSWLDLGGFGKTTLRYVPERGDVDFILLQFVVFIDPATFLNVFVTKGGRHPHLDLREPAQGLGRRRKSLARRNPRCRRPPVRRASRPADAKICGPADIRVASPAQAEGEPCG